MEKIERLGIQGEKIVAQYLRESGETVIEPLDLFDSRKDMTTNGKTVEVKTKQLFYSKDATSIKENQERKCRSVDRLFLVVLPSKAYMDRYPNQVHKLSGEYGKIYEITDPKNLVVKKDVHKHSNNVSRRDVMLIIPLSKIEQPSIVLARDLTKEEYFECQKNTDTFY